MKPQFLLSILCLFFSILGYSQDKGYIAVSVGPSFPSGDFGSKDVNNVSAGLATTGAILDISYAQKFGKNLGLALLLRGQTNGMDEQPLINQLRALAPTVSWTAESSNWAIGGFMGGLYSSYPMSEGSVTFETRALIGYISANSPEITVFGVVDNESFWVTTESATGKGFGYLLGVGLKYSIGEHLGLFLNIDYLSATPKFEDVATFTSLGMFSFSTYDQKFRTVNVGVGIGYRW